MSVECPDCAGDLSIDTSGKLVCAYCGFKEGL
jgi:DNA-directed RNA polymerase subunit RPC12/RpoP